jgi:hypothetical protein
VKAPTLLRYLRTIPDPPKEDVTGLGIDDFALRRADAYGTILVNLETRRPLDLLPDREASVVKPWLASHPDIQVVSRDRASAFADAVSQVLPHATQVADRSHLVPNLREHLQRLLDHQRSCLPFVEDTAVKSEHRHAKGASKLDPYLPYLREQWDAGMHNGSRLFELVKKRGYTGCQSGLRKRLAAWRAALPPRKWPGPSPKPRLFVHKGQRRLSSRSASFLMIVPPEQLTARQQHQIEHLCQASSDLHSAYLHAPGIRDHAQRAPGRVIA